MTSSEMDRLAEAVATLVIGRLADGLPHRSRLLSYEEAAAYCRCALSTLRNARSRNDVEAVVGGAGPRFRPEDLDRWLSSRPPLVRRSKPGKTTERVLGRK